MDMTKQEKAFYAEIEHQIRAAADKAWATHPNNPKNVAAQQAVAKLKPAKAAKVNKVAKEKKAHGKGGKVAYTKESYARLIDALSRGRATAAAKRAAEQKSAKVSKPATKRPVRADKTAPTPADMLEAIYRKVVGQ